MFFFTKTKSATHRLPRIAAAVGLLVLGVPAVLIVARSAFAQAAKSAWDGVYTDEQATRGREAYQKYCAECHGDALRGDTVVPALAGTAFANRWQRGTVTQLFARVQSTMPIFQPQSLSDEMYADIVAYMLKVNKYAAGRQPFVGGPIGPKPTSAAGTAAKGFDGFYTVAQAERGKARFRVMCSGCHSADAAGTTASPKSVRPAGLLPLGGKNRLAHWENARNMFDKMRRSMPEGNAVTISSAAAVDVLAYILQENGFPAGSEELKDNDNQMRSIMFSEPGFERLFNGHNLEGFQFLIGNYCGHPGNPPCRTVPGSTYKVEDYLMITTGQPNGVAYTTKKYLNFTWRLEYRYARPSNWGAQERNWGDTGYFIFIYNPRTVSPTDRIELQGGPDTALLVPIGARGKISVDSAARARAVKPMGEWNTIEIVAKDRKILSSLNGQLVSTVTDADYTEPGYVGLQSEGSEVHWRNIRIRPE